MAANFKAELVACFGQPVAENPTGAMQEAAFRAAGLDWRYLTVEVAPKDLADAMRGVRAFGMRGINLTIPHKMAVMRHLDEGAPAHRRENGRAALHARHQSHDSAQDRGHAAPRRRRPADRREYGRE